MKTTRTVLTTTFVLLFAIGAGEAARAAEAASVTPVLLTDQQMDRVTAGLSLALSATALASGNFALTETNGAGASGTTALPGGGSVQSGAVVGTAVAYAPGGGGNASTTTSGAVPGATTMYISAGGTMTYPGGQTSISATFVSGGPTFLP